MKKFDVEFEDVDVENQEPNSVYINGVKVATKDDWDKLMNDTCLELYNLKVKFNEIIDVIDDIEHLVLPEYDELENEVIRIKQIVDMK